LHVIIQRTCVELAAPDPDQLMRDVMALGQRVERLPGEELLSDLPLERRAVRPVLRHGFHPPDVQQRGSIQIA
jgi:hypothetical protein